MPISESRLALIALLITALAGGVAVAKDRGSGSGGGAGSATAGDNARSLDGGKSLGGGGALVGSGGNALPLAVSAPDTSTLGRGGSGPDAVPTPPPAGAVAADSSAPIVPRQTGDRPVPPLPVGPPVRVTPPATMPGQLAQPAAPVKFRDMSDAFRAGMSVYNMGDKRAALHAFSFAAEQGHTASLWKLGRMYEIGDGVSRDHVKAFMHYQAIADRHAEESPFSPLAPYAASAFLALGEYRLTGIVGSEVRRDPVLARKLISHAAMHFRDSNAQFRLAQLFLEGIGGPKDKMQAARWLKLAAAKCHRPAQALLGSMLFRGVDLHQDIPRGLALLAIARAGADESVHAWIVAKHDEAFNLAREQDRLESISQQKQLRCQR